MNEKILIRTDKNGTKYYHNRCTCFKCGGTGMIEVYRPINGGECFDCNGAGWVEFESKEYTPEYEEKLRVQAEKRAAKKLAKAREQAAELNAEFYSRNGFNSEGKTYVVLGNTFDIKEELKAQGAKWDRISRHWHMPTQPEGREFLELTADDMYFPDAAGVYDWRNQRLNPVEGKENYTDTIYKAEQSLKAKESTSQHVGEIGEKLTVEVTYIHTSGWENDYGGYWSCNMTYLHTFKDEQGNVFIWKTGKCIEADYGTKFTLKGTVKDHSEYTGVKQTALTRCKLENSLAV